LNNYHKAKKEWEGNGWKVVDYFNGGMTKSSYMIVESACDNPKPVRFLDKLEEKAKKEEIRRKQKLENAKREKEIVEKQRVEKGKREKEAPKKQKYDEKDKDGTVKIKPKTNKPEKRKKGGKGGCGLIIFIVVIIAIITNLFSKCGPSVEMENGVAKAKIAINTTSFNLSLAADQLAKAVYKIANRYDEAKSIEVKVYIPKSFVSDKYGKAPKTDPLIGTLTEYNPTEVRKYDSASSYAYKREYLYASWLKRSSYGYMFK